ncbi:MAG TPA: endonuclease domain-containing protein [Candidatus Binatia bacterium]
MRAKDHITRERARQLRRDQTDAEQRLWANLRDRQLSGAKFRRQHPIGPFVADFCCPQRKLVVELDGGQHAEDVATDDKRSRFLEERGYRVLRFWNHDVLQNTEAVLDRITEALSDPHPCPLPKRARGKRNAD